MKSLVLYSTDNCTLCDEALDLLFSMPELKGWSLTVIDVATDPRLIECYGDRLPVVRVNETELAAPFVRAQLAGWLRDLE
ncbi:MAG: glutaredoxin family protein [Pseudomonadales bacterium]|jgi:hypothetical protein